MECMYAFNDYFPSTHFIVHWTGTFLVKVILSWTYQWYMTGIYSVYTWYIPRFYLFWFWVSKCIEIKYKTITTTQHQHVHINANAGDTSCTLEKHDLLSWYIWQVDTRYMFVISGPQHASWPFWFLQRAGPFQTWTVCVPPRFQRPKARRFEAGACQSSTARCWFRRRDCPCETPGLIRQHSRIQRPASV